MKSLPPAKAAAIQRTVLMDLIGRIGGRIKVTIANKPATAALMTTVTDNKDGTLTVEITCIERGKD